MTFVAIGPVRVNFFKKFFQEHYQSIKPDQDQHSVDRAQRICKGYQLKAKDGSGS